MDRVSEYRDGIFVIKKNYVFGGDSIAWHFSKDVFWKAATVIFIDRQFATDLIKNRGLSANTNGNCSEKTFLILLVGNT